MKTKKIKFLKIFAGLWVFVLFGSGLLLPTSSVTVPSSAYAVDVAIDTNHTYQKIEGIGANYPWGYTKGSYSQTTDDPVARYTMDNLKPKHVRVFFLSYPLM